MASNDDTQLPTEPEDSSPREGVQNVARTEGATLVGIVKRYSSKNGYGFITVEDGGPDCFVHQSEIVVEGFRCLEEGARVQFKHVTRKGKPTATQVRPVPGARFKVFKSRAEAQTKVERRCAGNFTGIVKWFDLQKGFGFVLLEETNGKGPTDVFVHIKEVQSQVPLTEGQRVAFELKEEAGGRFRAFNVSLVPDAVVPPPPYFGENPPFASLEPPFQCTGSVKFFNNQRGYGFITPSDGSPDIYFSRLALINGEVNPLDFVGFDVFGNDVKIWAVNVCLLTSDQGLPGFLAADQHRYLGQAAPLFGFPYAHPTPGTGFLYDPLTLDPMMFFQ